MDYETYTTPTTIILYLMMNFDFTKMQKISKFDFYKCVNSIFKSNYLLT
jgi:hypothetical protein